MSVNDVDAAVDVDGIDGVVDVVIDGVDDADAVWRKSIETRTSLQSSRCLSSALLFLLLSPSFLLSSSSFPWLLTLPP